MVALSAVRCVALVACWFLFVALLLPLCMSFSAHLLHHVSYTCNVCVPRCIWEGIVLHVVVLEVVVVVARVIALAAALVGAPFGTLVVVIAVAVVAVVSYSLDSRFRRLFV